MWQVSCSLICRKQMLYFKLMKGSNRCNINTFYFFPALITNAFLYHGKTVSCCRTNPVLETFYLGSPPCQSLCSHSKKKTTDVFPNHWLYIVKVLSVGWPVNQAKGRPQTLVYTVPEVQSVKFSHRCVAGNQLRWALFNGKTLSITLRTRQGSTLQNIICRLLCVIGETVKFDMTVHTMNMLWLFD